MLSLRRIAAPRIVSGRRVVLDQPYVTSDGVVLGNRESVVVKIDKRTFKESWRKDADVICYRGYGDLVFFGNADEYQVWHSSGKVLWKKKFPTSPFLRRKDHLWRFGESEIYVLDAASGETIQTFQCSRPAWPQQMKWFIEDEDTLLLCQPLGVDPVCAFRLSDQRILWEANLLPEIRTRYEPDCRGLSFGPSGTDRFIASSDKHVFGMSAGNGALHWGLPLRLAYGLPQVRNGHLYGWATSGGTVRGTTTVDVSSGEVTRDRVTPTSAENRFVIVREATGEVLVDRPLGSYGAAFQRFQEPHQGVLCRNHIAFTTSDTGLLAVFRLSDGELVWQYEHSDELFRAAHDDNRLYVRCADGTLVVFEGEGDEL